MCHTVLAALALAASTGASSATINAERETLFDLSMEQILDATVTSVAKKVQKLEDAVGEGAEFTVTLPLAEPAVAP